MSAPQYKCDLQAIGSLFSGPQVYVVFDYMFNCYDYMFVLLVLTFFFIIHMYVCYVYVKPLSGVG